MDVVLSGCGGIEEWKEQFTEIRELYRTEYDCPCLARGKLHLLSFSRASGLRGVGERNAPSFEPASAAAVTSS